MSNAAGTQATREEEIAFIAMEEILGVDIRLADAGAGNMMPDGAWLSQDGQYRRGIVEITSPPAAVLMKEWVAAKRDGRPQIESGSVPTRFGELAQVCTEMLATDWARENLDKLLAQPADERHLFLFGRGHDVKHYFYRLSDSYQDAPAEHVEDLELPEGISDVWFRGRARRDPGNRQGSTKVWLARFRAGAGWHRYVVTIDEQHLPSPNAGIVDDPVPGGWREPKDRSVTSHLLVTRAIWGCDPAPKWRLLYLPWRPARGGWTRVRRGSAIACQCRSPMADWYRKSYH